MKHLKVMQQATVERALLQLLIEGLQKTLAWKRHRVELSRKLALLKYLVQCFQTHLEQLMRVEERDGYMDAVLHRRPHLCNSVGALRCQHDEFRGEVRLIVGDIKRVCPTDQNSLNRLFDRASTLLKRFDAHNKKETDLFVDSYQRDEGGEG